MATELTIGDRVIVRTLTPIIGTVEHVGTWEPSAAGTPGRWVRVRTDDDQVRDAFAGRDTCFVERI